MMRLQYLLAVALVQVGLTAAACCGTDNCPTCRNGGVLQRITVSTFKYSCECPAGFSGDDCSNTTSVTTVTPPFNPCSNSPCKNGGVCEDKGATYQCKCATAYYGTNCDSILHDCTDIKKAQPAAVDGLFYIYLGSALRPVQVPCEFVTAGGGWTVIQRRYDGALDFSKKTFKEYAVGFSDGTKNFWLGNDNIADLVNFGSKIYELRFELGDGTKVETATYNNFKIGGADTKYLLQSVGSFMGTEAAGDSFTFHLNQKFSTQDQDNDSDSTRSCATTYTGAWWYKDCHRSNLNGVYGSTGYATGINWLTFSGHNKSLSSTSMKIRPIG